MRYILIISIKNPLSLGLLIISQSIFIALIVRIKFNLNWFRFLIFIIYLGGILILFSYIIRISFNEKPINKFKIRWILRFIFIFIYYDKESFLEIKKISISKLISALYKEIKNFTLFIILFLFYIITAVIFLTEKESSSSKKK